jgi:acyl-CoA synthetase (NDP forming)
VTSTSPPGARDLRSIFDPSAIAVIGASENPKKWGYWLTIGALRGRDRRTVMLVNRTGDPVLGETAYTDISALPTAPELIVTAIPNSQLDRVIDDALDAGARAIIAINAGFAETGPEGRIAQLELVERVRRAGAMLVGPNCLGVLDNFTDLEATWLPVGGAGVPAGELALLSQSGNLALDMMVLARDRGLGISRFASVGNQSDVTLADLVRELAGHDQTRAIGIYCEDVADGRALVDAMALARTCGKEVLLLAAGASAASARAACSHTGSLTSPADVVRAAADACGATQVATPEDLIDTAELLLRAGRPRGRRVCILSDGGGHAVVGADIAAGTELEVVPFSPGLTARLAEEIDTAPATGNPIDLGGAIEPTMVERAVAVVADSGEVDAIVVVGGYAQWAELEPALGAVETESAVRMADHARSRGMPLVVQTFFTETATAHALRDHSVPVFRNMGPALAALGRTAPAPVPTPRETGPATLTRADLVPDYFELRRTLETVQIDGPRCDRASTLGDALLAADRIGYPVALKAIDLVHKTDAGGVSLGLADADALSAAFQTMAEAGLSSTFSVEEMVLDEDGVELLVGLRDDIRFGAVLAVALGGIHTELLEDAAAALAPCPATVVEGLLARLRGAALLGGARGRRPVDLPAAAAAAARFSTLAGQLAPRATLEINPLLVTPDRVLALDVRLTREETGTP